MMSLIVIGNYSYVMAYDNNSKRKNSDKLVMAESKEETLIFGLDDWLNEIFFPGMYWVRE